MYRAQMTVYLGLAKDVDLTDDKDVVPMLDPEAPGLINPVPDAIAQAALLRPIREQETDWEDADYEVWAQEVVAAMNASSEGEWTMVLRPHNGPKGAWQWSKSEGRLYELHDQPGEEWSRFSVGQGAYLRQVVHLFIKNLGQA